MSKDGWDKFEIITKALPAWRPVLLFLVFLINASYSAYLKHENNENGVLINGMTEVITYLAPKAATVENPKPVPARACNGITRSEVRSICQKLIDEHVIKLHNGS